LYDQETDILYISFSPGERATTAVELNDNVLLRFNKEERRAIGLTLIDFSVLAQSTGFGPRFDAIPITAVERPHPGWAPA
jgi:uncharacterized protein YuzE